MSKRAFIVSGLIHSAAFAAASAYIVANPPKMGEPPNLVEVEIVAPILPTNVAASVQNGVSTPNAQPLAEIAPVALDLAGALSLLGEMALASPLPDQSPTPDTPPPIAPIPMAAAQPQIDVPPPERALKHRLPEQVALHRQGSRLTLDMLGDVLFELDSAELRPEARALIGSVAPGLARYSAPVMVNGFTDTSGTWTHNRMLSSQRAKAVARELVRAGIDRRRVRWQGLGANGLAVPTAAGVREARNRRVEIVLLERHARY